MDWPLLEYNLKQNITSASDTGRNSNIFFPFRRFSPGLFFLLSAFLITFIVWLFVSTVERMYIFLYKSSFLVFISSFARSVPGRSGRRLPSPDGWPLLALVAGRCPGDPPGRIQIKPCRGVAAAPAESNHRRRAAAHSGTTFCFTLFLLAFSVSV